MNREEYESEKINEFLQLVDNGDKRITSTGARVVSVVDKLYNVDGSKSDPKLPGYNDWKKLLIAYGIPADSKCYITNETPSGNSHDDFSVGGHMTLRSDGSVPASGICYLMPECHWHNNKARDGVAYSHTKTKMLELSGYMQGELAATFLLRLPSSEAFGLLYNDDGWQHRDFAKQEEAEQFLKQLKGGQNVEHHLFERHIQVPLQALKLVRTS